MLMNQIEALEAAKRRAASSYTRMVAHPLPQATAQVTRDEQDVLCARVDVLNALLRQQSETPLCLEATGRKGPRVCVTYDRLRCEGELELGPMQSTMAWAVRDAEDAVLQLMSSQDSHPPAGAVKALLDLVRQSAPKKDILQGLHAALSMPGPERLVLKSLQGVNALETDGHTRVYEGLGEADGPTPPLYRVLWGALSLDVLEGWQNPSTNAAIRLSILHAAHQAAREAQQTKAPQWSNVAYLQVRVYHGDECHRLSLRPFWDSESCTVSHIQFRQSVFDDSGPERGLLNLGSDPNSIHPIPMGKILPLEAYVCLGAHRKSRLSEAQLNYVHAQGLLAHGFDTKLLPDSARLLQVQPGRMPPAKATRVSGDKLDVMASSYHLADQVYTTISVVQYPPFGTQFERTGTACTSSAKSKPTISGKGNNRLAMDNGKPETNWGSDDGREHRDPGFEGWDDQPMYQDNEQGGDYDQQESEYDDSEQGHGQHMGFGRREFKPTKTRQTQNQLYLQERLRIYQKYDGPQKKHWFTGTLEFGQFFFIDGVHGDPYDLNNRIILFDFQPNDPRYTFMEAEAKQICRDLRTTHGHVWDPELSFYANVLLNAKPALVERGKAGTHFASTIGEEWSRKWSAVIKKEIEDYQINANTAEANPSAAVFIHSGWGDAETDNFFYCSNQNIWHTILKGTAYKDEYMQWSKQKLRRFKQSNDIPQSLKSRLESLTPQGTFLEDQNDQIPLPQTRLSARSDPAVSQLQSRIAALESKLGQAKQDENTQFLLAKVLDKLDAIEEV
jgi:hypothetical protein